MIDLFLIPSVTQATNSMEERQCYAVALMRFWKNYSHAGVELRMEINCR